MRSVRTPLAELLLFAYLETDLPPQRAAMAAAGWGGDAYVLLKGPEDENLLVSLISWDGQGDAQEFFDTFLDFMGARSGVAWEGIDGSATNQVMNLPGQSILLSLRGQDTLLIWAPDAETLQMVSMAFEAM